MTIPTPEAQDDEATDLYETDVVDCLRCDGSGELLVCPDDLCRGAGECMHGEMSTGTTPTPEALAKAEEIMGWYPLSVVHGKWSEDASEYDEQWRLAVARELDAFATARSTEQAQAHPDCHPAALCDGPEQVRARNAEIASLAGANDDLHRQCERMASDLRLWKDMGEKEHMLAVLFAKERP